MNVIFSKSLAEFVYFRLCNQVASSNFQHEIFHRKHKKIRKTNKLIIGIFGTFSQRGSAEISLGKLIHFRNIFPILILTGNIRVKQNLI